VTIAFHDYDFIGTVPARPPAGLSAKIHPPQWRQAD
jgi:hypothetical protein